jgi:hypothetical protein
MLLTSLVYVLRLSPVTSTEKPSLRRIHLIRMWYLLWSIKKGTPPSEEGRVLAQHVVELRSGQERSGRLAETTSSSDFVVPAPAVATHVDLGGQHAGRHIGGINHQDLDAQGLFVLCVEEVQLVHDANELQVAVVLQRHLPLRPVSHVCRDLSNSVHGLTHASVQVVHHQQCVGLHQVGGQDGVDLGGHVVEPHLGFSHLVVEPADQVEGNTTENHDGYDGEQGAHVGQGGHSDRGQVQIHRHDELHYLLLL